MEEGLLPLRVGVVAADDVVARPLGARADVVEARHLEGDVVETRTPLREKSAEEARGAEGLDDLDAAAALEAVGAPGVGPGWAADVGHAAPLSRAEGPRVGHLRHAEGDVVEGDGLHPPSPYPLPRGGGEGSMCAAQARKTSRAAARARPMPWALTSRGGTARRVPGPAGGGGAWGPRAGGAHAGAGGVGPIAAGGRDASPDFLWVGAVGLDRRGIER